MTISAYKRRYKDKIKGISMDRIFLREAVHKKGNPNYKCRNTKQEDCCVIVRKVSNGDYILVSGWADYMDAKIQGYDKINAIVTSSNRNNFFRKYGTSYISIDLITVPKFFRKPKEWKVQRVRDRLGEKKKLDKPITLDNECMIKDGYTRYIVANEKGIKYVPVIWYE